MINKKILGLIGLSAKARKVCFGADSVETQVKKGKVKLIIIAEDSSERTKDKFKKIGNECNVPTMVIGEIENLSNNKPRLIQCSKDHQTCLKHSNINIYQIGLFGYA